MPTFLETALVSKKRHLRIEFSLRATLKVRLSQEREMCRGGAGVRIMVAFREDTSAEKEHKNIFFKMQILQLMHTSSELEEFNYP